MSARPTRLIALLTATVMCVAGLAVPGAVAAPSQQEVTADQAALNQAVARYEAALADAAETDAQVRELSAKLDELIAQQNDYQERLQTRVAARYRTGNEGVLSLLLGASSFYDLAVRVELLERTMRYDAETLAGLEAAQAEVRASASDLQQVQAEEARALEALEQEVTAAKQELASSQSALKEYEARVAAAKKAAAEKTAAANDATQKLSGTGDWKTAVASHYSATFTGTGASGEKIGPYSMIVAHKTLPFGTLIEFEYNGKRAVAHVADRGPYVSGREFDLGPGVVRVLGFSGVHEVRYRIIG